MKHLMNKRSGKYIHELLYPKVTKNTTLVGTQLGNDNEPMCKGYGFYLNAYITTNVYTEDSQEIWMPIAELENHQVSNLGRVKLMPRYLNCRNNYKRLTRERIRKLLVTDYKYLVIQSGAKFKHYAVHRLVAKAFLPNPDNLPCVNHLDGDKHNANVLNLEWCTYKQNTQHALETGLIKRDGSHNGKRKLNEEDVRDIRMFAKAGLKAKDIVKVYPIKLAAMTNVINRVTWRFM